MKSHGAGWWAPRNIKCHPLWGVWPMPVHQPGALSDSAPHQFRAPTEQGLGTQQMSGVWAGYEGLGMLGAVIWFPFGSCLLTPNPGCSQNEHSSGACSVPRCLLQPLFCWGTSCPSPSGSDGTAGHSTLASTPAVPLAQT